ncbi:glycosyltransferase [Thermoleptolyngbya sp. M55_K2018_002]|uniref:glycosyltransferase family 2 protein n=1 Tax=Thermoleptolyngbya sp. M55_K2018_002 TaxID=2747808 RepID=UPI001A0F63C7|nr:glycosyltransferase [Thermoleptolyngbya sp. M55_K2018_002]HIK40204.1 glycosyltransferase [Thermoleptolyngbya sp. M55_K2018_002]
MDSVGVVAIGRNEGDRLRQCLSSVVGRAAQVVYVDSGSTDGSVELARSLGAEVVALDLSIPFTAARARNAGFARLLELLPQAEFVQFVDGDCEIVSGWIEQATQALRDHPDWAVVCGRRRERFPDATLYNRLCDMEWNTPVGEAKACGGDALMRVAAVQQVRGYNPALIAGEEPELCVRLRQQGWKIFRLDAEMTLHDANMTRFAQWWKRTKRAGHAYAEGSWLHGAPPERHWVKETRSIWLWGLGIPLGAIALAPLTKGLSLLLLLGYPLMAYRIYRYFKQQGYKASDALPYAASCVLGKFPGLAGVLQFHANRLLGRRNALIEYK